MRIGRYYSKSNNSEELAVGRPSFVQRRSVEFAALLVGALAGLMGALFQLGVGRIALEKEHLANLLAADALSGWAWAGLLSALMLILSLWLVRRFALDAAGSGIQEIEGFLAGVRPIRWWRVLPVKFFGGLLALGSGMILGREGPSVQMGGNGGAMVNDMLPSGDRNSAHALVAAGAAAGLAAAFNAPLAGMIFVLEEMRSFFRYSYLNVRLLVIAVLMSTLVVNLIVGEHPALPLPIYHAPVWYEMLLYLLLGGILGVTGAALNNGILKGLDVMEGLKQKTTYLYLGIALFGFGIGILHYLFPEMVSGGYELVYSSLEGHIAIQSLFFLILIRFILTIACFCSGVPGGVFAPIIVLGTIIGLWYGEVIESLFPMLTQNPYPFAVAGMGALFAATVQAPITGVVLVVEMTGNYSLIIPIMIACVGADMVAHKLGALPLYSILLERLKKSEVNTTEQSAGL